MPLDTAATKAQCIFCHHACCICRRVGASKYILAFRHCIANCWVTLCSTSILYPASKSSDMIQNLQVAYWVDATLRARNISSKPCWQKVWAESTAIQTWSPVVVDVPQSSFLDTKGTKQSLSWTTVCLMLFWWWGAEYQLLHCKCFVSY